MKGIFKDSKAVSPVIATVILVSVTIVVAVAVAYWMSGIAGIYTRFEKIEIESCSTVKNTVTNEFDTTIQLKNTGSADATVTNVYINGKILGDYLATTDPDLTIDGLTIPAGQGDTLVIHIPTGSIASGTTIELKLHTAAGMDYPQMVVLP